MINLGFSFFTKYWKDLAIGFICATLVFITVSWWNQSIEIGRLKTQLNLAAEQNATLVEKVAAFEKAEDQAKQAIAIADKNRVEIISVIQKEINKIRTQPIPKDCNGAVNYGVKFKDDMKWPERSSQ